MASANYNCGRLITWICEIVIVTMDNYFIIHTFENEPKITLQPLKTITLILKYSLEILSLTCKND